MTKRAAQPLASGHYITFRLGDELFAINVFQVREVLDLGPVTRVPTAPSYLRGVVNVRGKAIAVVNLRERFGMPPKPDTPQTRIVVLELDVDGEHCVVGGLADSVHEVIEIEASQMEPPPSLASRWRSETVRGMVRRDQDFIQLLDASSVLSDELRDVVDAGPGGAVAG